MLSTTLHSWQKGRVERDRAAAMPVCGAQGTNPGSKSYRSQFINKLDTRPGEASEGVRD